MVGCFGQTMGRFCSFNSEQLFLGKFSVNVSIPPPKGMEPEVVECNGREKKEAKLELSSFSVTIISVMGLFQRLILDSIAFKFKFKFTYTSIHSNE